MEGFVFDCLFVCLILYLLQKCWYNWIFFIFHISCCVNIYVLLYWKRLVWTNTNTSLVHSFFCDIHVLYSEILPRYQLKTTLESPTFTCKWTFYFMLKIALANIKVGNSKIKFKKTPKWIYKDYNWKFWIFWVSWKFKVWNPNLKICNSKIKMWKSKFKVRDFNV